MGLLGPTATVKSIDPAAFMDQAASDYVLAVRVLYAGSIIMTHAVRRYDTKLPQFLSGEEQRYALRFR